MGAKGWVMDRCQAEKIAAVLSGLRPEVAEAVLAEFDPPIQQAILDEAQKRDTDTLPESLAMLEHAIESRWQKDLAGRNSPCDIQAAKREAGRQSAWFADLSDDSLLGQFQEEYPQTVAICLSALSPERAALMLASMESSDRVVVLERLRDLAPTHVEGALTDIEAAMAVDVEQSTACEPVGIQKTKAILDRIPTQLRQELWQKLSPSNETSSSSLDVAAPQDLRAEFTKAIEVDPALASLEFARLLLEQWQLLDPLIEYFSVETLYKAAQGLDLGDRQTFYGRLPDAVQLQMDVLKSKNLPVVVSQIHEAQASILKRALASDGYRLAVWHSKRHISVSA